MRPPRALPGAPRRARRVELVLLVAAVALTAMALTAVNLGAGRPWPEHVSLFAGVLSLLFGSAHVIVRRVAAAADPLLLPLAAALNGLGLALIYRLDLAYAARATAARRVVPHPVATLQLAWTGIGVALFITVLIVVRQHQLLQRYAYSAALAGLVLLFAPALLPARFSEVNGARLWIRVGGFSVQPSEIAKIALVVFFADYFTRKRDVLSLATRRLAGLDLPRGRDLGPVALAWLASLLVLVQEKDLGTSLLFFGIFVVMLYITTERLSWLLIGLVLFAGGATVAYQLFGHVRERVDIWLHPFPLAATSAYQLLQGLFGLATGGIFGTGLGQGRPEIVPFANTDFITTTAGEELGLVGLMAILMIYLLVVERGLRSALSVRDGFGKLLAAGLAFALALQVFVVVGGVTRLIPLTGKTMPFLSYGGSSLVGNYIVIALLMRISDAARRAPAERQAPARPPTPLAEQPTEVVRLPR
ncbi:MAG: FtsW/RodA/SpoVE family cell cycle protein [Actinomycetota bacterium]|nr:FtsW/RodA/SpoVE family cell cycle protein [Actinomycetota bacterium]